ncbi:MAG TPA: hypothetical protein VN238_12755 [Solirubrobacteraceae bacterium]|nr:hypothetical protein [Solirubrobacteraceae bacterium]
MEPLDRTPQPVLALRRETAAAALGVSVEFFDRYVRPEVRATRRGRLTLYPRTELQRWLDDNSDAPLAA